MTPLPPSPLIGIVERNITLQFSEGNDLPPVTPADITWLFTPVDGSAIPISSNPDIKYTFSSDMLSLTITALALADEGDYELVVRTIAGNASANIILDIQGIFMWHYCDHSVCKLFLMGKRENKEGS